MPSILIPSLPILQMALIHSAYCFLQPFSQRRSWNRKESANAFNKNFPPQLILLATSLLHGNFRQLLRCRQSHPRIEQRSTATPTMRLHRALTLTSMQFSNEWKKRVRGEAKFSQAALSISCLNFALSAFPSLTPTSIGCFARPYSGSGVQFSASSSSSRTGI